MKMGIRFIMSLLFSIAVALFAIQNANSVNINFFFTQFNISQALIILISAISGAIIVLLMGLIKQIRQNMKIKALENENEELKEEIDNLKREIDKITIIEFTNEIEEDKNSTIEKDGIEEEKTNAKIENMDEDNRI